MARFAVRSHHLVLLGMAAVLFAGLAFLMPRRQPDWPAGTSWSDAPDGTLGLYFLLRDLGEPVRRIEHRPELVDDSVGVVVVVTPSQEVTDAARARLTAWVERGGAVVWIGPSPGQIWDPVIAAPARVRWDSLGIDGPEIAVEPSLAMDSAPEGERALVESEAGVHALVRDLGRGRWVTLPDPAFATNEGLARADHAVFLTTLLWRLRGGRGIALDEYSHGFRREQSWWAPLVRAPFFPGLVQAAVAGLVLVWGAGLRFGPVRSIYDVQRRRPAEFLDAFVRLSRGTRAYGLALRILEEELGREAQAAEEVPAGEALARGRRLARELDARDAARRGKGVRS